MMFHEFCFSQPDSSQQEIQEKEGKSYQNAIPIFVLTNTS